LFIYFFSLHTLINETKVFIFIGLETKSSAPIFIHSSLSSFIFFAVTAIIGFVKLERLYKLDEDVLKYMTLAFKTKKEISAWKNLVAGKIREPKTNQRKPREDNRGGYRQDKSNRNDRYQRPKEDKIKVETKLETDAKPTENEKKE
jgi:CRISPR/Cas system-associated protein Cas5 (RAMP superfamily)